MKSDFPSPFQGIKRKAMVGWYDPPQLLRTGLEVIISTLFARHSDSRRLDAIESIDAIVNFDRREMVDDHDDFWFDYVADCGDGWDSTYAVAYALAQPSLDFRERGVLRRGRLLVFGGDLVYPTPHEDNYNTRLIDPYHVASQFYYGEREEVVAIPGNHDWYDSLVAFRRLFFRNGSLTFRHTSQIRSYFAAILPRNWWLFAADLQLNHDLDPAQYKFFSDVCSELSPEDRVIICLPEPIWIYQRRSADLHAAPLIASLQQRLGGQLVACIAGDLHHYRRHTDRSETHFITCGTGGAFLHPTHELDETVGDLKLNASYPSKKISYWLTFMNLVFILRNPKFGIITAASYLLAGWQNGLYVGERFSSVELLEIGRLGLDRWQDALITGFHSALLSPIGLALYAMTFWGFIFFADRSSTLFRFVAGALHAISHVLAGFLIYWFAAYIAITVFQYPPKSIPQYLVAGTIIFVLSWIVGSVILGTYLLISLNAFRKHSNEAFSSLRIQDWKGFLRGCIRADGTLELRFIGLRKVPRRWIVGNTPKKQPVIVPGSKEDLRPTIEDEIFIAPANK